MIIPETNTVNFLWSRKHQQVLSVLLFVVLFAFGCIHAAKGIDLTDEGMYLSTALRYSMGDIPFRDEVMNVARPFDVLVSPVFKLFPDISLFQMRLLGNILHTFSCFLLFVFLSGYAPPFLAALLCGVMFLMNNFHGILSPSYNSISSDCSLIAVTLWLLAVSSRSKLRQFVLAVCGGIFLGLAAGSYSTAVLVACVPIALLMVTFFFSRKRRFLIQPTAVFIGTFIIIAAAAVIVIVSSGAWSDLTGWAKEITRTNELRIRGPFFKIYNLMNEFLNVLPRGIALFLAFLFSLFIVSAVKRRNIALAFAVPLLLLTYYILSPVRAGDITYANRQLFSFAVILAVLSFFFNKNAPAGKENEKSDWNYAGNILISWGFVSSIVYGISSDAALRNCMLGTAPLFSAGMISFYNAAGRPAEAMNGRNTGWSARHVMIFVIVAAFMADGFFYYRRYVYREAEISSLTEKFSHPRLTGVYSTPEKVKAIEELLGYLNHRVKPGDYFLAYNYVPMMYFLTHTRPAYSAAWARDDWPLPLREKLLNKMIENNRIPEYCVRMLTFPEYDWKKPMVYDKMSPLDLYVKSNFSLEKIIYPFEVWQRIKK